jgi:hypothetical protein
MHTLTTTRDRGLFTGPARLARVGSPAKHPTVAQLAE